MENKDPDENENSGKHDLDKSLDEESIEKKVQLAKTKYLCLNIGNIDDKKIFNGKHVTFFYFGADYPTSKVADALVDLNIEPNMNCGYLSVTGYATDFGPNKNLSVLKLTPSHNLAVLRNRFFQAHPIEIKQQNFEEWTPHITLGTNVEFPKDKVESYFRVYISDILTVDGIRCSKDNIFF